ncbi:Uncharacterised protein [Mycobacteroides abscessus subsp. abscessus]|nr:Uncharacterised protein [Mycobacteroides abscessus subsp. abscessus]
MAGLKYIFLAKFIFAAIVVLLIGSLVSLLFKKEPKQEDDDLDF